MGFFKRKDLICGMKGEKGKVIEKNDKWVCKEKCVSEFEGELKSKKKGGCCCEH